MKKILIMTILVTSILFGCGANQIDNPEPTKTPNIEQSSSEKNNQNTEDEESEIDFNSYADMIRLLAEDDGFISVEELIETDLKLGTLVDKSFFKKMLNILNEYNEEHADIGLTVENFNNKINSEKK